MGLFVRVGGCTALAAILACRTQAPSVVPATSQSRDFQWPLPERWRKETIPFPLGFAPDLPYSGVEEIRFAPGMFKPGEQDYWSYAFVWWLDGRPALDAPELERTLTRYWAGLTSTVATEKKLPIDPARFTAAIHPAGAASMAGHDVRTFAGTVDSYDAFVTGETIVLNVEVWVWDCDVAGKRVAMILASPKPPTDPIWTLLRQRRDAFACHDASR